MSVLHLLSWNMIDYGSSWRQSSNLMIYSPSVAMFPSNCSPFNLLLLFWRPQSVTLPWFYVSPAFFVLCGNIITDLQKSPSYWKLSHLKMLQLAIAPTSNANVDGQNYIVLFSQMRIFFSFILRTQAYTFFVLWLRLAIVTWTWYPSTDLICLLLPLSISIHLCYTGEQENFFSNLKFF